MPFRLRSGSGRSGSFRHKPERLEASIGAASSPVPKFRFRLQPERLEQVVSHCFIMSFYSFLNSAPYIGTRNPGTVPGSCSRFLGRRLGTENLEGLKR